jgi:solute:Na+ symporter, SSS family
MHQIPVIDLLIIVAYLLAMVGVGWWFSARRKTADQFTRASGRIPGWAIGLSIYATFLSSNTFLGLPGKAFGGNWSPFVFSLSMPFAAWFAIKYFIPFYRRSGEVSAYTHLENRFGAWARTFAVVCFILTQFARMGSVFFGIALSLQAFTGYGMTAIIVLTGLVVIVYTLLGGIEAVIWTEVVQAIIKTAGALIILALVMIKLPGGLPQIMHIGRAANKFSLGSLNIDFSISGFWVVFLYGFFMNLNNFGVDQNYVQRYHTTISPKEAAKSLWLCVKLYLPASLLFLMIGTGLYAYYQLHPELLTNLRWQTAREQLPAGAGNAIVEELAGRLKAADFGDKVMPNFIVTTVPVGLAGLIIAAILSAAMSTISSGMNATATVFTEDIYKRYFVRQATENQTMRCLYISTFLFGSMGILAGIAMIGVKSILDLWWQLSGFFAAGMLGLFLLGIISRTATNGIAIVATLLGLLIIVWMSFPSLIPQEHTQWRSLLHQQMVVVVGTTTLVLTGLTLNFFRKRK